MTSQYERNKEKLLERQKVYYNNHKAEYSQYYQEHKEEKQAYNKEYYEQVLKHKRKSKSLQKAQAKYYRKNNEKWLEYYKQYYHNNKYETIICPTCDVIVYKAKFQTHNCEAYNHNNICLEFD